MLFIAIVPETMQAIGRRIFGGGEQGFYDHNSLPSRRYCYYRPLAKGFRGN
ncbi:hypothetical protein [Allopontixanthobacter sp.]|uniref:hypothetical protein n=1 Tax=Allopontixanthobacter sp. TaxID=2906452 RepID=UPI002AC92927|nr:hypothetical protein [Allopontixanthobacter sp.]